MMALFLFEGEKIACERVYFDSATILRQLTVLNLWHASIPAR